MESTSPLTPDEQRFILAEVIKASPVTVEALTVFIRANNIPADLMNMQLPRGRNMKQCLQLLNQLGVPASLRYSPPLASSTSRDMTQSSPRRSLTSKTPSPPKRPALAYIAPRPSNGALEGPGFDQRDTSLGETRKAPKKRGRPSKADMAKRDLKPMLPQLIAPRPLLSSLRPFSRYSLQLGEPRKRADPSLLLQRPTPPIRHPRMTREMSKGDAGPAGLGPNRAFWYPTRSLLADNSASCEGSHHLF